MEHRFRELNRKGFFAKLWVTVVLLVFGALVTPLLVLGVAAAEPPLFHAVMKHGLEALGIFYAVLLVYVWWRPAWLTALYSFLENELVRIGQILEGIAILGAVLAILYHFIHGLLH
jgi:hypothetical protein